MRALLDGGDICLVGPLGYATTGEVFNCSSEDVATVCAIQLGAQKLIFLYQGDEILMQVVSSTSDLAVSAFRFRCTQTTCR